jgi:hypothetical protein
MTATRWWPPITREFDNKDEWLKEMEAAGYKDFVCVSRAT